MIIDVNISKIIKKKIKKPKKKIKKIYKEKQLKETNDCASMNCGTLP